MWSLANRADLGATHSQYGRTARGGLQHWFFIRMVPNCVEQCVLPDLRALGIAWLMSASCERKGS